MRRLNAIAETLLNASSRKRYDAQLAVSASASPAVVGTATKYRKTAVIWTGTFVLLCGALVALLVPARTTPQIPGLLDDAGASQTALPPQQIAFKHASGKSAVTPEIAKTTQAKPFLPNYYATPNSPEAPAALAPAIIDTPPPVLLPSVAAISALFVSTPTAFPDRPATEATSGYAGVWSSGDGNIEYELRLQEQNGLLLGSYAVHDQKNDSLIVNVEFAGKLLDKENTFLWAAEAGARGYLSLRLISENRMDAYWRAQAKGPFPLSETRAVLVRLPSN